MTSRSDPEDVRLRFGGRAVSLEEARELAIAAMAALVEHFCYSREGLYGVAEHAYERVFPPPRPCTVGAGCHNADPSLPCCIDRGMEPL